MKKLAYSGAFLTEAARDKLLEFVEPVPAWGTRGHYTQVVAHHVTMQFKPSEPPSRLGEMVMLRVLATASDQECLAAVVAGVETGNYFPHITIAHTDKVKPFYSNEMLKAVPAWTPMREVLELEARIGVRADGKVCYSLEELT